MLQPHEAQFLTESMSIPDCVPTVFVAAAMSPLLGTIAFLSKRYFAAVDRDRVRLEKMEAEKDRQIERLEKAG